MATGIEETTTTTTVAPDETTTTTTSEVPETTTTTTEAAETTTTTLDPGHAQNEENSTVTNQESRTPLVDEPANDRTTNDIDQNQDALLDEAKALGLHNHAVEHAEDPVPTTGDKTVV